MELARAAAGVEISNVSYGAQLVVVCHSNAETALEHAMIMAPPLARFQVMEGAAAGPGGDDASLGAVRAGYDMNKHGGVLEKNKLTHGALSPDFVRRFAIAGTPEQCTCRLLELRRAGLERFVIVGPGFYPEEWGEVRGLFTREVIPALRAEG
jgi:5,10-methylenetetrahydromethanopterin reductase